MNEELKMIQDEINRCVYETFNGVSGYDGFSIPCIPRISSQYLKNRFVILAQETNTWYPNVGHFQDLASSKYCNLEKILYENCYDDFVSGLLKLIKERFGISQDFYIVMREFCADPYIRINTLLIVG